MSNLINRKKVGEKFYYNYPNPDTNVNIKIITSPEYRTKGEEFILVKNVDSCKLILNSSTTKHIMVKTMTNVIISSFMGKIDEDYDEVKIGRGACVEFICIENQWYIISSDGLKMN